MRWTQKGYPPEFNVSFKRYIRKRDGHRCTVCGRKRRLDVHHIDYNKQKTTKKNCISLCRKCHDMIHRSAWIDRHNWMLTLSKIALAREEKR